jgi:hypothetical protein
LQLEELFLEVGGDTTMRFFLRRWYGDLRLQALSDFASGFFKEFVDEGLVGLASGEDLRSAT